MNLFASFHARILQSDQGLRQGYIEIPFEVSQAFISQKIRRVYGKMNEVPFNLALISDGKGGRRLIIGKQLRKSAKVDFGHLVQIEFQPDQNPDEVLIPEELEVALSQDEDANAIWKKLTPGYRRSLCHYINSVKNIDSRIKRALELTLKIKTNQLYRRKIEG